MSAFSAPPREPLDAIMQVMDRAFDPEFGEAWSRRQVADALVLPHCRFALIDGQGHCDAPAALDTPAGFFLARRALDEEELLLFAIDPAFRRRGLGHALIAEFLDSARANGIARVLLEMRRDNPAGALYAQHGFKPVGLRPAYYKRASGGRIDAITYERRLEKPA